MKRRLIGIVGAVALVLVGTMILMAYVNGAEDRAVAGEKVVDVLVVAQQVKKGTPAAQLDGKVKMQQVPQKVRADGAVTRLSDLKGLVANADLVPGEQLVRARFDAAEAAATTSGVDTTNLVKLSVSLDAERALGGRLKAGDIVTVIESYGDAKVTKVELHQIPVIGVDGALPAPDKKKAGTTTLGGGDAAPTTRLLVTLAVTEEQAGKLVWGLEHGSIWLGLEPAKADQSNTGTVNLPQVFP